MMSGNKLVLALEHNTFLNASVKRRTLHNTNYTAIPHEEKSLKDIKILRRNISTNNLTKTIT